MASITVSASKLFKRTHVKWSVRASVLVCAAAVSGCCSHREGDVVMKGGDAYVFTKTLSKEQIAEGKEIERLWIAYYKTNQPSKTRP